MDISAALKVSDYVNVDDTGARHDGRNGYCTHIGNELFAWFRSTNSKSRINFLELLRAGQPDYVINEDALQYMITSVLRNPYFVCYKVITKSNLQISLNGRPT